VILMSLGDLLILLLNAVDLSEIDECNMFLSIDFL
jgi:hypothetical protein